MLILSQIEVNWKVVMYATIDSKRANTIKKAVNGVSWWMFLTRTARGVTCNGQRYVYAGYLL